MKRIFRSLVTVDYLQCCRSIILRLSSCCERLVLIFDELFITLINVYKCYKF